MLVESALNCFHFVKSNSNGLLQIADESKKDNFTFSRKATNIVKEQNMLK
jgi:hypothetical protein